jgi:hypothetical protein
MEKNKNLKIWEAIKVGSSKKISTATNVGRF